MSLTPAPQQEREGAAIPDHSPPTRAILLGIVGGLVCGLAVHYLLDELWRERLITLAQVVGKLFLRMMFMVVVPLVVSALALAVTEIGDLRRLGKLGVQTLTLTLIFSMSAVLIGVGLVNLFQPGRQLPQSLREELIQRYRTESATIVAQSRQARPLSQVLIDVLPENPLQEMVGAVDGSSKGNGMLAVMAFSLVMGLALAVNAQSAQALVQVLQGVQVVAMTIIGWALKVAPLGAGCLVFALSAQIGLEVIRTLGLFAAVVTAGLLLQLVVVYSLMIRCFTSRSPWRFYQDVSAAMATAFGTSSSNATLPTAIRVADENLHLPAPVSRFVLTVGATGNQNGTALYEGVVILFLAQVMGVELGVAQQFQVVLMSVLAGIGTAGVPGGSLPLVMVVMQSVGVPPESIGLILGLDRLLDMLRTTVNVTGDLAIATCVAGWSEAHTYSSAR